MNLCLIVILLCCCCRGDRGSVCCTEAAPQSPCERERLICSEENAANFGDINATSIEISEEPAIINEWKL